MGKYLSERPELDAEWKMDPSKCRNDLNMLVKDAPRCCTYQRVCFCGCSPRPGSSRARLIIRFSVARY